MKEMNPLYQDQSIRIDYEVNVLTGYIVNYWYAVSLQSTGDRQTVDIRTMPLYIQKYKGKSEYPFIHPRTRNFAVTEIILDALNNGAGNVVSDCYQDLSKEDSNNEDI